MPFIIAVDGIIGAGKTTFIKGLEEYLKKYKSTVTTYLEPVEKWSNILNAFYKDPSRYALQFQLQVVTDKYTFLKQQGGAVIVERSFLGDSIFMDNLHDSKLVTDEEHQLYHDILGVYTSDRDLETDCIIYLKGDIDTCMQRIKDRGRESEQKIPKQYQEDLVVKYEEALTKVNKDTIVVIVPANALCEEAYQTVWDAVSMYV
jgi:deoxyadenosine/deoxycytidine kinase